MIVLVVETSIYFNSEYFLVNYTMNGTYAVDGSEMTITKGFFICPFASTSKKEVERHVGLALKKKPNSRRVNIVKRDNSRTSPMC